MLPIKGGRPPKGGTFKLEGRVGGKVYKGLLLSNLSRGIWRGRKKERGKNSHREKRV